VLGVHVSVGKNETEEIMGQGGRRDRSEYTSILAEVFYDTAKGKNGVRPCAGQPFSTSMKVECARVIRNYPIGSIIRLDVVETDRDGSRPFLYSSYKWPHERMK
jgi:hypothetical protein